MILKKNFSTNKTFFITIIISLVFIFTTNSYFTFEESLIFGAADGNTYMAITKNFPIFEENGFARTHNQRFLFPYLVGSISYFLNIEPFLSYRIVSIALLFLLIYLFVTILDLLKINLINKTIAVSFIIFNPYLLRYYIALPTLINDVTFLISAELLILGFVTQNKKFSYIGIIVGLFSRQTAIFYILTILINKFILKKSLFNIKDFFFLIIIFFIINYINNYHSLIAASGRELSEHSGDIFGLINFFKQGEDLYKLFIFILFPFLSWAPLILFGLSRKFYFDKFYTELNLFIIICSCLIFIQPLAAGPLIADKNIIRLTNYAYPFLLVMILNLSFLRESKIFSNLKIYLIIFIFWSFHPTYSLFNLFK